MKHYTLLYKIRAIIKVLIFVQLIIILIYGVLNCFFVIRFFSIAYLFMILIISISAYRLLKHYIDNATPSFNARSIFKLIFIPVLIMLIILSSIYINKYIHHDEKYYSINSSENIGGMDLYVREITTLGRTSGCLVVRVNDYIYKPLPKMNYYVEAPYSPIESSDYSIEYNDKDRQLIFYYKSNENDTSYKKINCILD